MAKLLNKMLNLVGWEIEEEEEDFQEETIEEQYQPPQYLQTFTRKPQTNKVVNIHTNNQFKVVIMQPETFDDAREICDQLKNKKPVVVNLECLTKKRHRESSISSADPCMHWMVTYRRYRREST